MAEFVRCVWSIVNLPRECKKDVSCISFGDILWSRYAIEDIDGGNYLVETTCKCIKLAARYF